MIKLIRRNIEKIRRMPPSRGFGIQSPWAYHTMVDVIARRQPYSECNSLRVHYPHQNKRERQRHELLFRLSRRINATGFVDTTGDIVALDYVKAGSLQAVAISIDSLIEMNNEQATIYRCNIKQLISTNILSKATPESVLVVEGIRDDKTATYSWNKLRLDPICGITFDLYNIGLVFFDKKIIKQHYIGPLVL